MIRRDVKTSGEPDRWMLFSQVHHAVFAGVIAEGWQSPQFAALEPQGEVLDAINNHDNGWAEWEELPRVDREHGRPYSFDEMPPLEAMAIWRRSIESGREFGPLVGYAIAGHFTRLARRFTHWRRLPQTLRAGEVFLADYDRAMIRWLAEWQAEDGRNNLVALAVRAIGFVQLFDALSLWFLTAARAEPATFPTPEGPSVTITPVSASEMIVDPWPYVMPTNQLSATGQIIPIRHYASDEELRMAPRVEQNLVWNLRPLSNATAAAALSPR